MMNHPGPGRGWLLLGFVNSILLVPMLMCACENLSWFALLVTGFGVFAAWFPDINRKNSTLLIVLFAVLVRILTTVILLKNIGDVLWVGHDALFPQTRLRR
jgi:hypothetical protein